MFRWLLVFIPLAAYASATGVQPIITFIFAGIAIIPLAKFIGDTTEVLASKTTAAVGGLLNVTFGNAPELIIGLFALKAGLTEVVKASITGSIIGNILFVLGTAMIAGGAHRKKQEFNQTAAHAAGSTLFLAATALLVPALLPITAPQTTAIAISWLSLLVSICMLAVYAATLAFSLRTHRYLYIAPKGIPDENTEKRSKPWHSAAALLVATAIVAWMSDILVNTIEPVGRALGWTDLFIGVVLVAAVGNAAEHTSAIVMAARNKMTLAIEISVGSAVQIAMFIAPLFVIVSTVLGKPMNLIFNSFELMSILLSIIIVNLVLEDGESNWLEGFQLVVAYAIMVIAFFLHP